MTSGNFTVLPVSTIIVNRDERQRKELTNIEELAESIRSRGQINPIVITRENELVAGERRLEAHKLLRFDNIFVQYTDQLDPIELHLIELEENIKRKDLSWQDEAAAVAKFHELQQTTHTDWSQSTTAKELGMSQQNVSKYLLVDRAIKSGVKEVAEAPKLSTAFNYANRQQERAKASAVRELRKPEPALSYDTDSKSEDFTLAAPSRYADIQQADFISWCQQVRDEPFNLIHCDFPYGVNAGNKSGQSAAKSHGGYDDEAEVYFNLLAALTTHQDRFISPSAHMIFWFSMDYYHDTRSVLQDAGWRVDPFPLVWHKTDNTGIIPDANRGPRRTYETALFCARGDRKIVRAVANSVGSTTTKHFHMSEKTEVMLEHFMRMLVDPTTYMLDPTCGGGNSVKVAEKLGASYSLGLELNNEYVDRARENLDL